MTQSKQQIVLLVVCLTLALLIFGLASLALHAQAPDPPAPAKVEISPTEQIKILKALRELDEIDQKKKDLVIKFDQLNQQVQDLKLQYQALDQPGREAESKVNDLIDSIGHEHKVDLQKNEFDRKNLTFVPKTSTTTPSSTAPPAPKPPAQAPK